MDPEGKSVSFFERERRETEAIGNISHAGSLRTQIVRNAAEKSNVQIHLGNPGEPSFAAAGPARCWAEPGRPHRCLSFPSSAERLQSTTTTPVWLWHLTGRRPDDRDESVCVNQPS